MNFKTVTTFAFVLLTGASAFAASPSAIDCFASDDTTHSNSLFTLSLDATGDLSSDDGAELQAEYQVDLALDTQSYAAFKIYGASQDGQQPAEIKISKALLSGPGQTAPVWLAPGIQGGTFQCTSR